MAKISIEQQAFYVEVLTSYPHALVQTINRVAENIEVIGVLKRNGEESKAEEVQDQTNTLNSLVGSVLQQHNSSQS